MIKRFIKKILGLYDERDIIIFGNYFVSKDRLDNINNGYLQGYLSTDEIEVSDFDLFVLKRIYKLSNSTQYIELETKIERLKYLVDNSNGKDKEDYIQRLKVAESQIKRISKQTFSSIWV